MLFESKYLQVKKKTLQEDSTKIKTDKLKF